MIDDGVIAITGGGTGIGAAIAERAIAAGYRGVAIGYRRSVDEAETTAGRLRDLGAIVEVVRVDVRAEADARSFAARCDSVFGRCDALVNAAGLTRWIPFDDLDGLGDDAWHEILDANVVGAYRMARAFAPLLRAHEGAIVNIASISAYRGIGSSIPYGVSKAALVQLTRSLAVTLGPEVRVTSVSPGTVETRWQLDRHGVDGFADLTAREQAIAPLARTTQPEDVADLVLGLLGSRAVTGIDVIIDGGKHLLY